MAHLVANPPPVEYWNPITTQNFSVVTTDGEADILAWGAGATGNYKVGIQGSERVVSEWFTGPRPDLNRFHLRGLLAGDKVALYRNSNFGTPFGMNWVRDSGFIDVLTVTADRHAASLAAGTLPSYRRNANIKFYPFGSAQRRPPIAENDWMRSVEATLDTICANALGLAIIQLVNRTVVIHPWISSDTNAYSDVLFTAETWSTSSGPGGAADEVLLHEFIHVLENNVADYSDAPGFEFDRADFISVNATNVYQCLLGRGLRKDHHGMNFLPHEYFVTPRRHFDTFPANYARFKARSPALYNVLKNGSRLWNPFIF